MELPSRILRRSYVSDESQSAHLCRSFWVDFCGVGCWVLMVDAPAPGKGFDVATGRGRLAPRFFVLSGACLVEVLVPAARLPASSLIVARLVYPCFSEVLVWQRCSHTMTVFRRCWPVPTPLSEGVGPLF